MGTFFAFFILTWGAFLGVWYLATRKFKSSDIEKVRGRLLGKPEKKAKAEDATGPALFELEEKKDKGQWLKPLLQKFKVHDQLTQLLEQAGVKTTPAQLVQMSLLFFVGGYIAAYLLVPEPIRPYVLPVALGIGLLPFLNVLRAKRARIHAFEEAFPDTLEFISRSMRAGHAFSVSLEMIHREFPDPISSEFRRTFEEHNLGLPLDVALQGLSKRMPLLDVQFFVSAVMLQKRTGGNLAEILDKLAHIIRERFKLRGKIRAISAHGRMTSIALSCIPLAVAVLMFFTNPTYVTFFFTEEIGNIMLAIAVTLQITGYLVMQKIVSIEV
jgi:tight adherence protein B